MRDGEFCLCLVLQAVCLREAENVLTDTIDENKMAKAQLHARVEV
jgi:hypothetical protein